MDTECPQCGGSGTEACQCEGKNENCPACEGMGTVTCSYCEGSGSDPYEDDDDDV
jgi:hypothetical protein